MGETVTDLQILGCELHQNVSGVRAPPGKTGGAMALPIWRFPIPLTVITVRGGGEEDLKGWEYGKRGRE